MVWAKKQQHGFEFELDVSETGSALKKKMLLSGIPVLWCASVSRSRLVSLYTIYICIHAFHNCEMAD